MTEEKKKEKQYTLGLFSTPISKIILTKIVKGLVTV